MFLISLIAISVSCFAGGENYHLGARSSAMGGASVTNIDVWSTHHNQAGLARLSRSSVGLYYESRFLLKELGIGGFAFAMPTANGTFGVTATQFGYSQYNETKVGLNYAMALGRDIALGIGINYHGLRVAAEDYGNKTAFTAEVGMLASLTDELTIGVHIFNPTRAKLAEFDDERIPTNFRLGFGYDVSEKVTFNVETEKDIDHPVSFKAGLEYHVAAIFYLRGGISTEPTLTAFGFGLKLNDFILDFSSNIHPSLGITPQFSMTYGFGSSTNQIDPIIIQDY